VTSVRVIAGNRAIGPGSLNGITRADSAVGRPNFPEVLGSSTSSMEGLGPVDVPRAAAATGLGSATEPNSEPESRSRPELKAGPSRGSATTAATGIELMRNTTSSRHPLDRQARQAPPTQIEDLGSQQSSTDQAPAGAQNVDAHVAVTGPSANTGSRAAASDPADATKLMRNTMSSWHPPDSQRQQTPPAQIEDRGSQQSPTDRASAGVQSAVEKVPATASAAATEATARDPADPTGPDVQRLKRQVLADGRGLSWRLVGLGSLASSGTDPLPNAAEGIQQHLPSAPTAAREPQDHPIRRSSHPASATDAIIGATSTNPVSALPARQFTQSAGNSFVAGDSAAPLTIAPLGEAGTLGDRPVGRTIPASAGDQSVQSASSISGAQDQSPAPDGVVTLSAGRLTDAASDADPADSALPDIPALRLAFSGAAGADIGPNRPTRPLAAATSPMSGEDVIGSRFRSGMESGENSHSLISVGVAADAPSPAAASTVLAGLRVEGSSDPSTSNPSPTALADQLTYQVVRSAQNGGGEIVLQLHPPELGDLTVRVRVDGRDVSAWFASPQIPVQQAISQAIGQLNTILGNAGYNLSGAWVGADARSPGERNGSSTTPQQRGNRSRSDDSTGLATRPTAFGVSVYV
jgi:hypothetical protein